MDKINGDNMSQTSLFSKNSSGTDFEIYSKPTFAENYISQAPDFDSLEDNEEYHKELNSYFKRSLEVVQNLDIADNIYSEHSLVFSNEEIAMIVTSESQVNDVDEDSCVLFHKAIEMFIQVLSLTMKYQLRTDLLVTPLTVQKAVWCTADCDFLTVVWPELVTERDQIEEA
eukprot:augustus_masked-scaffold_19-processed-gene-5.41-mRNA-1 protein AED:1.00 eAED:1.00 QI:0/-1/0/0/-1/1/1/0/170